MRYVNPLVEGSSPSPVIHDRTRQNPQKPVNSKGLRQSDSGVSSRQDTAGSAPVRPSALPVALPEKMHVADPDLAAVVAAWPELTAAIKAAILAMVAVTENR